MSNPEVVGREIEKIRHRVRVEVKGRSYWMSAKTIKLMSECFRFDQKSGWLVNPRFIIPNE